MTGFGQQETFAAPGYRRIERLKIHLLETSVPLSDDPLISLPAVVR